MKQRNSKQVKNAMAILTLILLISIELGVLTLNNAYKN